MFGNRAEAGAQLAKKLRHLAGPQLVVVGLARGGVPVAAEVAKALEAPMDVLIVRKVGVPRHPEMAMGAVGEGGIHVVNQELVAAFGVGTAEYQQVADAAQTQVRQLAVVLRSGRAAVSLQGHNVVVVDDGLATGSTARAAALVARHQGAARIVLAVPVASRDAITQLRPNVDEVIALAVPRYFGSVGQWYADFGQVTDQQVIDLLQQSSAQYVKTQQCSTQRHPT